MGNGKLASLGSRCPVAIKKHPVSQKNIKNVFDFANQGEDVIIKSRRGSFRIIPVTNEDVVYNDKQLTEMIDRALKQVQAGEVYEMKEDESAEQFINRMLEDSDQ